MVTQLHRFTNKSRARARERVLFTRSRRERRGRVCQAAIRTPLFALPLYLPMGAIAKFIKTRKAHLHRNERFALDPVRKRSAAISWLRYPRGCSEIRRDTADFLAFAAPLDVCSNASESIFLSFFFSFLGAAGDSTVTFEILRYLGQRARARESLSLFVSLSFSHSASQLRFNPRRVSFRDALFRDARARTEPDGSLSPALLRIARIGHLEIFVEAADSISWTWMRRMPSPSGSRKIATYKSGETRRMILAPRSTSFRP